MYLSTVVFMYARVIFMLPQVYICQAGQGSQGPVTCLAQFRWTKVTCMPCPVLVVVPIRSMTCSAVTGKSHVTWPSSQVSHQGGLSLHPCYSHPQAPRETSMAVITIQRICSSLKPQHGEPRTCPARAVHHCLGSSPSMHGPPSSAGTSISSMRGSSSVAFRKAFA